MRFCTVVLSVAVIAGGAARTHAVDLKNVLADYPVTSWGLRDGLPSDVVTAITQDDVGYLWLGTDAGLVRFDGVRFVQWSAISDAALPKHPVRSLLTAKDGSLWIGFADGGGISRIHQGVVTTFVETHGLGRASVTALTEDANGTIIAGMSDGLYALHGERWQRFDDGTGLLTSVRSTFIDHSGHLLIGTDSGLFQRDVSGRLERLSDVEGAVSGITEDEDSQVLITDEIAGLKSAGRTAPELAGLLRVRGSVMLRDRRGHIWLGTRGQGLWRLTRGPRQTPIVEQSTLLTGLASTWIYSLFEDREGSIWVGLSRGLSRLSPYVFAPIDLPTVVEAMDVAADGSVWLVATDRLIHLSATGVERAQIPVSFVGRRVTAFKAGDKSVVWVATTNGLFKLAGDTLKEVRTDADEHIDGIQQVVLANDGRMWLYDPRRGLSELHGTHLRTYEIPELHGKNVLSMIADRSGRIWFGSSDGSVVVRSENDQVRVYREQDGLTAGPYPVIFEGDNGAIWMGGARGLSRFASGRFQSVTSSNRIPIDNVQAIVQDNDGFLWLGATRGVLRMSPSELDRTVSDASHMMRYTYYDYWDGAAAIAPRGRAVRSGDGRLWFLTAQYVTVVDAQSVGRTQAPKEVLVEGLASDDRRFQILPDLTLPPRAGRIAIDYTSLDLRSPGRLRFRYRLDGFDDAWVQAGARRQAVYTNLPPGTYHFRVETNSDEGAWNEPGTSFAFSIAPTFYQTTAARILALALLGFCVWFAWRLRLWQVHRRFALLLKERVRLSNEIHDTLLQGLVGAGLQADAVKMTLDPSADAARNQLSRLRQTIDVYVNEARHAIWNLRSPLLEKTDLATALRGVGERVASQSSVDFDFVVTGTPSPCASEVEEQLLRIGHEAVVNAVRHARASHVRMQLACQRESLRLSIWDDGRGLPVEPHETGKDRHFGLSTMRERAESIGGRFGIKSSPGMGTEVDAVVPREGRA